MAAEWLADVLSSALKAWLSLEPAPLAPDPNAQHVVKKIVPLWLRKRFGSAQIAGAARLERVDHVRRPDGLHTVSKVTGKVIDEMPDERTGC